MCKLRAKSSRKHEGLRIANPGRISRLTASLHPYGQQTAVLAAAGAGSGCVLIDGYARVSALESLATMPSRRSF